MNPLRISPRLPRLTLSLAISTTILSSSAIAQITPDNTLGTESSFITPNVELNNRTVDLIQGGAARGHNLFHSFQQFNINAGQQVYFDNSTATQAIFSRVTGNDISNILGTLGVKGNADLFLLNPNGILFGKNASLDIAGSFLATTAEAFLFEDDLSFSALFPQAVPLLTVNLTPGLQFGATPPQTISNFGQLQSGKNLTLAAGNLDIQGQIEAGQNLTLQAQNIATFKDTNTSPLILQANQNLLVQGNQLVDIFALNHPDSGLYSGQDLVLRSGNEIIGDAQYYSSGNFRIENLETELGALRSDDDPTIRAIGDVQLNDYSGVSLHIIAGGSVDLLGLIFINAADEDNGLVETITLSNGETVAINGKTQPTLDIRAGIKPEAIGLPDNLVNAPNNPLPSGAQITVGDVFFINLPPALQALLPLFPNIADFLEFFAFSVEQTGGKVLLTNQYQPNLELDPTAGDITAGNIYNRSLADGGVFIDSRSDLILTKEILASSPGTFLPPFYLGDGGDVKLLATGDITLQPEANIFTEGVNSGDILLASQGDIRITDSFVGNTIVSPAGKGSSIDLFGNNITLDDSIITAQNFTLEIIGSSDSGDVTIQADTLALVNGATITTETLEFGNGGNIFIEADDVSLSGKNQRFGAPSQIISSTQNEILPLNTVGNAGSITVNAKTLAIADGGQINANVAGAGNGGDININATDFIRIDGEVVRDRLSGIFSRVEERAEGNAGQISINTGRLEVFNGAKIDATTFGEGNAGKVTIDAADSIVLDGFDFQNGGEVSGGIGSQVAPNATGDAGGIEVTTGKLDVLNGAQITASTLGEGNAEKVVVTAADSIQLDGETIGGLSSGIFSKVNSTGSGHAGGAEITTGSLTIRNGAQIDASTSGVGNSGEIQISSMEFILLDGEGNDGISSGIYSEVEVGGTGQAEQINVEARDLTILNGARISASTAGVGNAGNITITAMQNALFDGESGDGNASGVFSQVEQGAVGKAGNVEIIADRLQMTNGARISAGTVGVGDGGNIGIGATNLRLTSNAKIDTNTFNDGNAGNIKLTILDQLSLQDSFIEATTTANSTGKGGSIDIDPILVLLDRSQIRVDSEGAGVGGDILLVSDNLELRNNSAISSETFSSDGGNLTLNVEDTIRMFENSQITTTAGLGGLSGDGGNIEINASLIFSIPNTNNDISANAFEGDGGNVNIFSDGIFGFVLENTDTPRQDPRNNITASSRLGTSGEPNVPNIFTDAGVETLPVDLVDPSGLIDRRCIGSAPGSASEFRLVGKGGRSPQPSDIFDVGESLEDIGPSSDQLADSSTIPNSRSSTNSTNSSDSMGTIVEAQNWQISQNEKIQLVATSAPNQMQAIAPSSNHCNL